LPETLDSILSQSFADYELLVIDDHSTDGTEDLLAAYAEKDARIRFIANPERLGMVDNWNRCLSEARGRYIKYVFADDLLPAQDALQTCFSLLESDQNIPLVGTSGRIIDSESRTLKTVSLFGSDRVIRGTEIINLCLARQENLIGEPTAVMFRKAAATRGFDAQYSQIVDLEMWFHLLEKGCFAYVHRPLAAFRVHSSQQTILYRGDPLAVLEGLYRLNEDYLGRRYVSLNSILRSFIRYDSAYKIWKLYLSRQISKEKAIREIESRYGYRKFQRFYPTYKLCTIGVFKKG
jgi:glycosyltransferase involved in cell wall biosynthesis